MKHYFFQIIIIILTFPRFLPLSLGQGRAAWTERRPGRMRPSWRTWWSSRGPSTPRVTLMRWGNSLAFLLSYLALYIDSLSLFLSLSRSLSQYIYTHIYYIYIYIYIIYVCIGIIIFYLVIMMALHCVGPPWWHVKNIIIPFNAPYIEHFGFIVRHTRYFVYMCISIYLSIGLFFCLSFPLSPFSVSLSLQPSPPPPPFISKHYLYQIKSIFLLLWSNSCDQFLCCVILLASLYPLQFLDRTPALSH